MKKVLFVILLLGLAQICPAKNPLFFGADPSGRVWPDSKMWIYPTTDKADWDEQFDWHAWSSEDLVNWTDHGVIFHVKDSGWATGHAWAPDILYKDGNYYFYYYAQQGKPHGGVGVAVSQTPEGPFKEALGHQLIRGHDPGLFLDDDGQAYLYLQNSVTLLGNDMISLKGETMKLQLDRSPSKKYEAVYVFKRKGIYYYTIADGFNHLIYYMGDSPTGPFTYKGEIMEKYGGNNHHSIVEYKGRWILWYHGWVPGHHRRVRGEYLQFNPDATIIPAKITEEGVGPLTSSNTAATNAGGYLFAHMTKKDYGRLYYSVSQDALHWTLLNDGKRVCEDYRGHPDICRGHDGRYYMTGGSGMVTLWVSDNLVSWSKLLEFNPDVYKTPDFMPQEKTHGAPKIYYDIDTAQYLITWHTSQNKKLRERPEHYWSGQRTLYITSTDLKTFAEPKHLFQYDMATIDVIIRKINDRYHAIIKDEHYPSFEWPTGKSIRLASSANLTGPWTDPSSPITPNFREAPTLIRRPDYNGWYLYYEQYPGIQYGLSTAPKIEGPWYDVYIMKYSVPKNTRHGCMIGISQKQHNAIMDAYANKQVAK